jgi:hypothetical protein
MNKQFEKTIKQSKELEGKSLYLLGTTNKLRIIIYAITKNKIFDTAVLIVIILSTISLSLEHPLSNPDSRMNYNLSIIDIVCASTFLIECLLKILSNGFLLNGKSSYLRNRWNIFDFFIVLMSLLTLI